MSSLKPTIDNKYILNKYIDYGGSSKVYRALSQDGLVAIKFIRKDNKFSRDKERKIIEGEWMLMTKIGNHPNVVNLLHYNLDGLADSCGDNMEVSYCALEYCPNGSLYGILKTGYLPDYIARLIFIQIASAIMHLHDHRIAHLDIKPSNILLDKFFNAKLADLGWALEFKELSEWTSRKGTKNFMAPEIYEDDCYHTYDPFKADVYSLGITLYYMLTGEYPDVRDILCGIDSSSNISEENINICSTDFEDNLERKKSKSSKYLISEDILELIEKMIEIDPYDRCTIYDIFDHPWLSNEVTSDELTMVYEFMSNAKRSI